uniref:Uncharacterized protein n=1 Tax=Glossina palpalis gambiensis TaxID=67801 RepID=A0A1B0C3M7_9MUSC
MNSSNSSDCFRRHFGTILLEIFKSKTRFRKIDTTTFNSSVGGGGGGVVILTSLSLVKFMPSYDVLLWLELIS